MSFQECLRPQLPYVKGSVLTGYGYIYAQDKATGIPVAGVYETNSLVAGSGEEMLDNLSRMFPSAGDQYPLWQSSLGQLFDDNARTCFPSCNVLDIQLAVVKVELLMDDQQIVLNFVPEFGQTDKEPPLAEPIQPHT